MATRLQYRNAVKDKLIGLEDSGYGDLEYSDSEHNTYLELAVARLYPAVYQRKVQTGLSLSSYGTSNYLNSVTVLFPERVYLVEDASELNPLLGWSPRATSLSGIDRYMGGGVSGLVSTVNVYYHDAFEMPADDVTDAGIAAVYKPLVVLGALVEALESRHDTGVRPDPSGPHEELQLIDRLQNRYDRLKEELAMVLPAVIF